MIWAMSEFRVAVDLFWVNLAKSGAISAKCGHVIWPLSDRVPPTRRLTFRESTIVLPGLGSNVDLQKRVTARKCCEIGARGSDLEATGTNLYEAADSGRPRNLRIGFLTKLRAGGAKFRPNPSLERQRRGQSSEMSTASRRPPVDLLGAPNRVPPQLIFPAYFCTWADGRGRPAVGAGAPARPRRSARAATWPRSPPHLCLSATDAVPACWWRCGLVPDGRMLTP